MRSWSFLLVAGLLACSSAEADITLNFATPEARARTTQVAYTAFEPILAQPDTEDQTPRFIGCEEVGPFPPTRIVDPDTLATIANLAGVVTERSTRNFPIEGDWLVDIKTEGFNEELNPWGAVMVFVEARGEVREPASVGGGQVTGTLLSGCFCLRTQGGSHPDVALDQRVKQACRSIEGDAAAAAQEVLLAPVVSDAFRLGEQDGVVRLTAPRREVLSPGPAARVETTRCDTLSVPGTCFDCEQPCTELDDLSQVPIQFTVFRGNQRRDEESQVVLTDELGRAEAALDVGDCADPIRIEAQVVGRSTDGAAFEVDCVDELPGFSCPVEVALADEFRPQAVARVVGQPDGCPAEPRACDHVAVLSDNGRDASLEIHDPFREGVVASLTYPEETAYAVLGYFYDVTARPARPAVAVATAANGSIRLRVYEWDFMNRMLVPHDGVDGIIESACQQWVCGSLSPCSGSGTCSDGAEVCRDDVCQTEGDFRQPECQRDNSPVYCNCDHTLGLSSQVTLRARDLDQDGLADLAIGSSDTINLWFLYSARRPAGTLYGDNCVCGLFGVTPNAFGLMNLGGPVPAPREVDLVLGSTGGLFVRYADREISGVPVSLRCGQPIPIADRSAVRDVSVASLRCLKDDPLCPNYDDFVSISARTVSGGSLNDPGTVRIVSGGPVSLEAGEPFPQGTERQVAARSLDGRTEPPEDPQRLQLADYNGDRHVDLAVLYQSSQEIHVWLGASNGAVGEIGQGIALSECLASEQTDCFPLAEFAAFDGNGDGRDELAVICSPSQQPRLRVYTPRTEP